MFTKTTKLSLLTTSIIALTACQSVPNPSTKTTQLTAHQLMKHTMLHRFDKSYDYEKNTHYQIDTLYQENDIERQDVSVFLSLIQGLSLKARFDKEDSLYDTRPERLVCETDFRKAYNQALKPFVKDETTDLSQINENLEKVIATYDSCLADLPPLPASETLTTLNAEEKECEAQFDKDIEQGKENAIDTFTDCLLKASGGEHLVADAGEHDMESLAYAKNFETLRDTSSTTTAVRADAEPNNEYTTINSIIDKEPSFYQTALLKATEMFKEIDKNNQEMLPVDTEKPLTNKLNREDIGKMLVNMRLTPEQIELINKVYLVPQTIRYRGSYDKQKGQFSTVVEDFHETPYSQAYKRIPMLLDMNEMSVVFEPDVALPLISLIFDKELPDLHGKSVKFTLPEDLRQNIPLSMIKDSVFKALGQAYGDLNPEKFSEVMPDDYAKSIQASRVIKIHLSTHDIGFMIGRSLKYFVKDLQQISEKHPEFINNNENFKLTLEFLQSLNKVYRADDLAKLSQLVETVIPLSYNSFNYYYFDNQNDLIGYRKINDYQSSLFNAKAQSITTNQFNYQTLGNHRYYQPKDNEVIDGNALLKTHMDNKKRETEAKDARFSYAYEEAEAIPDAVRDAQDAVTDAQKDKPKK